MTEHDDDCDCLCETIDICVSYHCYCLLTNAIREKNFDMINEYLNTFTKNGNVFDTRWSIYGNGTVGVGTEFITTLKLLREYEIEVEEIDTTITDLSNEWMAIDDSILDDFHKNIDNKRDKWDKQRDLDIAIEKLELLKKHYSAIKNTFEWNLYLTFKKHNLSYVF